MSKHPLPPARHLPHFVASFLKRNKDLSLRKPQGVAINGVFGLNKDAVERYFSNLAKLIEENNLEPFQIYNCDESGLTCVHNPVKVLAQNGKHVVSSMTSGERGITTTILVDMNATGHYVPPLMVFKRKRMKSTLIDHAPVGTIGGCSPNGWINTELFMMYILHFVKHTRCSPANKVLLIFDGHKSHTKNIELINYARENGLLLLSLSPHTSHKLQPLDRSYFKPLKSYFNAACSTWMQKNPGKRITVDQLSGLFATTYLKSSTVEIAASGFRTTGISPFNPNIISEKEFVCDPRDTELNSTLLPTESQPKATSTFAESPPEARLPQSQPPILQSDQSDSSLDDGSDLQVGCSVSSTFYDILPVPDLPVPIKMRGEQSEIITSSPYKHSLQRSLGELSEPSPAKIAKKKCQKSKSTKAILKKKPTGKKP